LEEHRGSVSRPLKWQRERERHCGCAHRRRESVDRAVARLPKGTEGYALDLSNEERVRDFFTHLGACDHLAFTAGERVQPGLGELSKTNVEQARHAFDLRFWGAFMAAKYGSSQMRPGGSIVLTSGIAGRRSHKGRTLGAAILGAVAALTRALAVELAPSASMRSVLDPSEPRCG
jgi:NAD(P)-dependent dehydrogenase (short-subunit alcohol dehydrogenase family)